MKYFEQKYRMDPLGASEKLTALATAHHRFNYIHPFLDGNGRVSRLMTHAMAHKANIGAHGLWSISRGLARGIHNKNEYMSMMNLADSPRRGDLDGRGNLSLEALKAFVSWFLRVCLDQIAFMSKAFELTELQRRVDDYLAQSGIREEGARIVHQALVKQEMSRSEAIRVTGLKERTGRDVLSQLLELGMLSSPSPKGAVSLHFPVHAAEALFPSFF
jgi:Fic family protein